MHPCGLTASTKSHLKADLAICGQVRGVSG